MVLYQLCVFGSGVSVSVCMWGGGRGGRSSIWHSVSFMPYCTVSQYHLAFYTHYAISIYCIVVLSGTLCPLCQIVLYRSSIWYSVPIMPYCTVSYCELVRCTHVMLNCGVWSQPGQPCSCTLAVVSLSKSSSACVSRVT